MARGLLKTHATLLERLLRIADPLWVAAAGIVAHLAYFGHVALPDNDWLLITLGAAVCAGVMSLADLYRPQRGISLLGEGRHTPRAKIVLATLVWLVYAVVLHAPINPSFRGRKVAVLSMVGFVLMIGAIVAVQFLPKSAT